MAPVQSFLEQLVLTPVNTLGSMKNQPKVFAVRKGENEKVESRNLLVRSSVS